MRCRQRSRRPAPSTLPAVRPTAAPCGRGARPLLRPGSWGRMAAPYNEATLKSSQYAQVFVDAVGFTYEETALRPQLRLCLAAKPALLPRPLFTIRWPARSAQTAQTRPASLNNQVTAMRGRSAAFAEGKGSATVRKAVSLYVKPSTSMKTRAYCDDFKVASL